MHPTSWKYPLINYLGYYNKTGSHDATWSVGTLLEILESLGKVKTLNIIKVHQELKSPTEGKCVSEIFQAALEIIDKKFPKNSTELKIKVNATEDLPEFVIIKEKDKSPVLKSFRRSQRNLKKRKFDSIDTWEPKLNTM